MSRLRRILHPTDFSRASNTAFARAVAMAKADRAELLLVHVMALPVPMAGEGYISPSVYEDLEASARKHAEKRLAALRDKARAAGVKASVLLYEGVAHEQIVRAAKSKKADLIVIGTHGRTGFAKLFLGSVASRVVTAGSRAEGLRLVIEPPRLVISDLRLPDGDGLDIIRAAKAIHPPVPVIVVTSFASAASRRAARASGAAAFLTKPFSASELLELVRIGFERPLS